MPSLSRRRVLTGTLGACLAACHQGATEPTTTGPQPTPQAPTPGPPPIAPPSSPGAALDVTERSFTELAAAMAEGKLTAAQLVTAYQASIEVHDRRALRSVLELNPDALRDAEALDRERAQRGPRGPLHGLPILLKDNIATADRTETTAGSLALVGRRPSRDAFLAGQLRRAGAVLLGKTNMSEWANFRSSQSVSGWSSRGGQTKNPYDPRRNPCGSSSGSAVAASASFCAAAVGTETMGSIVCPASTCGIVGLKPTVGLVSRAGIIPISETFDTAGPMARTVRDVALLLEAMQGVDARDHATSVAKAQAQRGYAAALSPKALSGARLGVLRNLFGRRPKIDAVMEGALAAMKVLGAEIVDVELRVARPRMDDAVEVMSYEMKAGLNRYLAELGPGTPASLADVIAFNEAHESEVLALFGQDLLESSQTKGPLTDDAYRLAVERLRLEVREQGIDRLLKDERLDALVAPTNSPAWVIDPVLGDHFVLGSAAYASIPGYPNITVPAGFIAGLPVGVSLFGPAWSEPRLLGFAYAFEQATQHRRAPTLT